MTEEVRGRQGREGVSEGLLWGYTLLFSALVRKDKQGTTRSTFGLLDNVKTVTTTRFVTNSDIVEHIDRGLTTSIQHISLTFIAVQEGK